MRTGRRILPGAKAVRAYRLICIALALTASACDLKDEQAALSYTVQTLPDAPGRVVVDLAIKHIDVDRMVLQTFEKAKFLGVEDLQVRSAGGTAVQHQLLAGDGDLVHYVIDTKEHRSLNVNYTVRPGASIDGGHGRRPSGVSGYLGTDFGLLSGRNLFLVPDLALESVEVAVNAAAGAAVVTTWPPAPEAGRSVFRPRLLSSRNPEDLVNGVLAIGDFVAYGDTIGSTPVRVFAYGKWPESYRRELAETSIALYGHVSAYFAAPITDSYTIIFTPPGADNLSIEIPSTSFGQGRDMWPMTPGRWISCTEEMAYRWLRHAPHRMEFGDTDDMWLVEGAAVYNALKASKSLGIIPAVEPYLIELYRQYNNTRLSLYQSGLYPAGFYKKQPARLRPLPREISAVFAHHLDELIIRHSGGNQDLQSTLQAAYADRYGLSIRKMLSGLVPDSEVDSLFADYLAPESTPYKLLPYNSKTVPGTEMVTLPEERSGAAAEDTITLVLTGRTQGFLEACGCKSNQSGGITRRATLIKQILRRRDNVAIIDAGNAFPDDDEVPVMNELTSAELDTYLESLQRMGYSFSTLADNEIYYGIDNLNQKLATSGIPFISANVLHEDKLVSNPTHSIAIGPYRVGFIGILQRPLHTAPSLFEDHTVGIEITDPLEAIRAHLPELRAQNDFVGVVGGMHTDLVHRIVENFPDLDLIITLGHHFQVIDMDISDQGYLEQGADAMYGFLDDTLVLYANANVYGLHQIDISVGADGRFTRFEGTALEAMREMNEDEDMLQFLEAFYSDVAAEAALISGQTKPLFAWDPIVQDRKFVGTDRCSACHPAQHQQWDQTDHADAYATLLDAHRHHYPKCVVCHVAGLGVESGFDILKPDRSLVNVQCEICHGPGSAHVQSPAPSTIRRTPPERVCLECHNTDHDDDFSYDRDYQLVKH